MDVWAASLFFVSPTDQRGQDKAIGLHKHSLKGTLQCNAPTLSLSLTISSLFPSRLMHKGIAHCKMSLAVIFIIWFIRCQKSTYASQAARVKKPSRIVVQQIVAHILPTISFNNPFEVQEGRKWNFNDIFSSPPLSPPTIHTLPLWSQMLTLPISSRCNFPATTCTYFFYWPFLQEMWGFFSRVDGDCFWMMRGRRVFKNETCTLLYLAIFLTTSSQTTRWLC